MDLKAAIDHIKRSTVPTDKWKADDFIADNSPPEAGETEAAFAAIMNAVADGTLAQDYGATISRLIEERDRLQTAIKRQAGAAKTLRESTLAEVQHLRDLDRSEYVAHKTLDSEREANARLTEEVERLTEQVNTLATEKHADSEAIGALREALSERAMERDEARRELEAMRNSGSWHKDDAIDRIEEAAGTAGFAQGIEAAADEIRKRWATTHAELEEYVRALSPTPQADPVREASQRLMPGAIEALSAYQQADMDGTMVLVSRQAIEECLPVLRALTQKGE